MSPEKIKKYLIAGAIVIVIVGITAYFLLRNTSPNTSKNNQFPTNSNGAVSTEIEPEINLGTDTNTIHSVSAAPIAGYFLFKRTENHVENQYIRYVDKATGNVYEYDIQTNLRTRITNTTIPQVIKAVWITPEKVVIRHEENGFNQNIIGTIEDGALEISTLASDIKSIAVAQSHNGQFVYSIPSINGSSVYLYDTKDDSDKLLSTIPLGQVQLTWGSYITISTLSSYTSNGFVYRLHTDSGQLTRIAGPFNALSFKDGTPLDLVSYRDGSSINLSLLGEVETEVSDITLADKCVWSTDNDTFYCGVPETMNMRDLPDSWYRGEIFFRDMLFEINPELGRGLLIYSPEFQVDMVDLSTEDSIVSFKNKLNDMLYYIDVNNIEMTGE